MHQPKINLPYKKIFYKNLKLLIEEHSDTPILLGGDHEYIFRYKYR